MNIAAKLNRLKNLKACKCSKTFRLNSGIVQALCFILYSGGAKHGKYKYK